MNAHKLHEILTQCAGNGKKTAVSFCGHIPQEILTAAGMNTIRLHHVEDLPDRASNLLVSNLCPAVKNCCDVCLDPAMEQADLILAETACDGKKKLFELLPRDRVWFYQIPQGTEEPYARELLLSEFRQLADQLEKRFGIEVTEEALRRACAAWERERRSTAAFLEVQTQLPPPAWGMDIYRTLRQISALPDPEERTRSLDAAWVQVTAHPVPVPKSAARVLITGCPIGGVYEKVIRAVEANGGVAVCFENCETMAAAARTLDAGAADIWGALADCYLQTSCAIMTPNRQRLTLLGQLVRQFRADCVLDVTLRSCQPFAIERKGLGEYCTQVLKVPYMAVETDRGDADSGQLDTRIAAFLEIL